jgi:8-oxo-dGTP diphosphatase
VNLLRAGGGWGPDVAGVSAERTEASDGTAAGTPLPDGPPDLVAAGVVCWRRNRDGSGLELLLVHRPGYDDWSWPKGKPERREGLVECAVREAAEETGVQVVLGRPLPPVRYRLPDGRIKEVSYWAARPTGHGRRRAPATEIDQVSWLPFDLATERLTYPQDAALLAVLADWAQAGTLNTAATLVIRHATARPRDAWARADADRPLVASGKRQAMALAALLQCWRPDPLLSSPWRRCTQTMDPYTAASGVRLRSKGGLSEDGFRRAPEKARRHVRRLMEGGHGGALCTHRPVLGGVLEAAREWSTPEVADQLPTETPFLHPGEVLVLHVCHRESAHPLVVAVERHGA